MSNMRRLTGRRIAALAADGFEKVELTVPMRALQLTGAKVDVVSLRPGRIRGVNLHMPASRIGVDKTLVQANPDDYDGLLLPGGFINPDLLRQSAEARQFVREFADGDKPIATLCHGPWVLASAGLLRGRTLTSWPGIRDDLVNAGATWLNRDVVQDGSLLTSRGPQDLATFVPAILDHFADPAHDVPAATPTPPSAPQLNSPVGWAVAALRWSPKPSIPAALSGLLAGVRLSHSSPPRTVKRQADGAPVREADRCRRRHPC